MIWYLCHKFLYYIRVICDWNVWKGFDRKTGHWMDFWTYKQDIWVQEASIRKHFPKQKPLTETMKRTDFLYCDPPEVILQSKINIIYVTPINF